jgi:hypothetical protein
VLCLGQRVRVQLAPEAPAGVAGVPAGVPPFSGFDLPMRAEIRRAE